VRKRRSRIDHAATDTAARQDDLLRRIGVQQAPATAASSTRSSGGKRVRDRAITEPAATTGPGCQPVNEVLDRGAIETAHPDLASK